MFEFIPIAVLDVVVGDRDGAISGAIVDARGTDVGCDPPEVLSLSGIMTGDKSGC